MHLLMLVLNICVVKNQANSAGTAKHRRGGGRGVTVPREGAHTIQIDLLVLVRNICVV